MTASLTKAAPPSLAPPGDDEPPPSRPGPPDDGRATDDDPKPQDPEAPSAAKQLRAADAASCLQPSVPVGQVAQPCPLKARYAVVAVVTDPQGKPLSDVTVELRKGESQAIKTLTDAAGSARFEGLTKGPYSLCLPALDLDAWSSSGSNSLGSAGDSQGDATWGSPTVAASSRAHTVEQGECVSELAARYGFAPETIWNAPENASLKQQRKNMNVLAPGDVVTIPAPRQKTVSAEVGKSYTLKRAGAMEMLRVRFLDGDDKPRKQVPYLVTLRLPGGDESREGQTDGDGYVTEKVPADVDTIELLLGTGLDQESYELKVGHLDPVDTPTGVQARLRSLGYDLGEDEEGKLGPYTKRALADFQEQNALPQKKGDLDDATKKKLEELYLS